MLASVYILEPQSLFVPELVHIVTAANGVVVRCADVLDIDEVATVRARYALLDLDYSPLGVSDALAFFRGAAPAMQVILLTEERDFDRLAAYRRCGASAVLSKSMTTADVREALCELFDRDAVAERNVAAPAMPSVRGDVVRATVATGARSGAVHARPAR